MKEASRYIRSLLRSGDYTISRLISSIGLATGMILLLLSVQFMVNIHRLLYTDSPRTDGFDYISISKAITNENMGKDNRFTQEDIRRIAAQPLIEDVSPLISNQYQVTAHAGNSMPFSSDLFLESLNDAFLDTIPPSFTWEEGQEIVPLIFSSDFLELYNVFAPAQGLPQISPKTISSVIIYLDCSGPGGRKTFQGQVVAMSDRVNSILVPEPFMQWSNRYFSGQSRPENPSRIYIKTRDINNPELITFLEKEGLHLNKEMTRFGRIKGTLQGIIGALGIFGILIVLLALTLFSFYIQLIIAKSRHHLRLLLTLGYSPKWLTKQVAALWLRSFVIILIVSIIVVSALHILFIRLPFAASANLPVMPHWSVFVTLALLTLITLVTNRRMVKKELRNM